jgi:hypothetical protein
MHKAMKGEGINSGRRFQLRSASELTWKFRAVFLCVWCLALVGFSPAQYASAPASKSTGSLTLNGTVVNSVTGETIGRALVRVSGIVQRTAFTDGEGRFQIDGLPAGSVDIGVKKPGFFSQQELNRSTINKLVTVGPETGPMLLKLTPQSAIYGRVADAAGQPIEVHVRLTERSVRDGRQHWNPQGFTQSDEDAGFASPTSCPERTISRLGRVAMACVFSPTTKSPRLGIPACTTRASPTSLPRRPFNWAWASKRKRTSR